MKRTTDRRVRRVSSALGCGAVLAAVLSTAPAKGVESTRLAGAISPSGTVTERVSIRQTRDGKQRFYRFKFRDLPLECADGSSTTYGVRSSYAVPVRSSPAFSYASEGAAITVGDGGKGAEYRWSLEATVQGRRKASGTLRARGRRVEVPSGGKTSCRSGPLTWETARTSR